MAILTDDPAIYSTQDEFTPPKVNATPRLPSEAWEYPIAQWANLVDESLQNLNSWFWGDLVAGNAGSNVQLVGGFVVGENLAVGGAITPDLFFTKGAIIGTTSDALSGVQLQSTNVGTGGLLFSDSDAVNAGGLFYDHSTDMLSFFTNAVTRAFVSSSGFSPESNNTYDLGEDLLRWRELWAHNIDVRSSAYLGSGAAAIDVTLDGGTLGGQEPRVLFQLAGVTAGSLRATSTSDMEITAVGGVVLSSDGALTLPRLTTVERLALTNAVGLVVYDTTENRVYWNDGTGWFLFSVTSSNARSRLMDAANALFPSANFATLSRTTADYPIIAFADGLTQSAEWYVMMPENYTGGNMQIEMRWTGLIASTNAVEWEFWAEKFSATDDLAVNNLVSTGTFTKNGPPNIDELLFDTHTLTNAQLGSPSAGDVIRFRITRNGASAADIYGNTARLLSLSMVEV